MPKRKVTVVQELIAKKRAAYEKKEQERKKLPDVVYEVMHEVFANNDEVGRNSPMYIAMAEAKATLEKVGFTAHKSFFQIIARELGRQSYARK